MNWPRWRKIFLRLILLLLLLGVLVTWIGVRHVAPYAILQPGRTGIGAKAPDGVAIREFVMADGIRLRGWIDEPGSAAQAVVIVLHGISSSKSAQSGTIRNLAEMGIVGVALDLRAHGESEGEFATYGHLETGDLSMVMDMIERDYSNLPVGLWGSSYGGAIALQVLAQDTRFDFGIIESTFADLNDVVGEYAEKFASLPVRMFSGVALRRAGKIAGFRTSDISPEHSMREISVPILHLHGTEDPNISVNHALRIGAQAQETNYRYVPIKEGQHFHLHRADPETYSREIDRFLKEMTGL